MTWTSIAPIDVGYFWWRDTTRLLNAGPTLVRAVWSAPYPGGVRVLLAGPWAGGLERVDEMGGEWSGPLEVSP